nr:methyltransferase regulatory domain-containing protein [Vitreoscilla sp.]
ALERIDHTLKHFSAMFESNPSLLDNNPALKTAWGRIHSADRNYLLHEYFNANWDCFSLSQVNELMQTAKLQFVGTTTSNPYINHLAMDENRLAQVQAQPNVLAAESWRDVLLSNTFRQDLYIKGGETLSPQAILRRLQKQRFVCTVEAEQFTNFLFNTQDSRHFNADLFDPIKALLIDQAYAPKSFAQIQAAVGSKYTWQHILQVLLLKISAGHLQPCVEQETTQTRQQCLDLNMAILGKLDDKVSGVYVASPVTGMALTLEYIYAWCLRTWLQQPKATQNDIAENIWQGLQAHGRVLVDEAGKNLSTREEHFKLIADKLSNAKTLRQLWQTLGLLP